MQRKRSAFTLVELLIVLTIVGILASIVVMTYSTIRQDARDTSRRSNSTIISEALEKYYEKNGEYPSVASLANSQAGNTGSVVAGRLSIPEGSLVMPNMPSTATNGIMAGSNPSNDYLAYEAESSTDNTGCQSSLTGGCDKYILRYQEESTGDLKALQSRHTSRNPRLKPELEINVTGLTSMNVSWTPVMSAESYDLQRSLSSSFTPAVTTSHTGTSTSVTGLSPDTEYFFRVVALLPERRSDWSDTMSDTTSSIAAPSGTITIAAAMSGTNARGTTGGGTCASGATIQHQLRYQVNGGTWSTYTTGTTRDQAATEGYRYTFQAQARCVVGTTYGPWAHSLTASVTRPVTAPVSLTIAAAMSGANARGTAGGGSCATGATMERQIRYQINTGSYVAYVTASYRDVAATAGYVYTFQQQARCVGMYTSSGWAASGTAAITAPVASPTGLTISATSISSDTAARGTAGGGSCPAGTTIERQIRYSGTNTTTDSYVAYVTGNPRDVTANQGYRYTFQQQARCVGMYASSGWTASGTAAAVRPIIAMPTGGSASVSTSGSLSTFSYNGVSGCPAGTTYVYTYRYMTAPGNTYPVSWDINSPYYGNPPHNWASQLPASTAYRTFAWNTSATNTKYHVHFAAMCATTHYTGPWPDAVLADSTSYYRP